MRPRSGYRNDNASPGVNGVRGESKVTTLGLTRPVVGFAPRAVV